MSTSRVKVQGFTLIELMIAISITAVIGLLSATMLSTMIDNHSQVLAQERSLVSLERTLQVMRSDIEHLAIRPIIQNIDVDDTEEVSIDTSQITGDATELAFSIYAQRPSDAKIVQRLQRVHYLLDEGKLLRMSINTALPTPNNRWQSTLLLSEVSQLSFSYYYDSWEDSLSNDSQHPAAIRILFSTERLPNIELIVKTIGISL